jgi:hypothetical protein
MGAGCSKGFLLSLVLAELVSAEYLHQEPD